MHTEFSKCLPEGWGKAIRFFSALGDPVRQKILFLFEPNEEISVHKVAHLFPCSRAALSHHFRILKAAELVISERRGKEVIYRLNLAYYVKMLEYARDTMVASASNENDADAVHQQKILSRPGSIDSVLNKTHGLKFMPLTATQSAI